MSKTKKPGKDFEHVNVIWIHQPTKRFLDQIRSKLLVERGGKVSYNDAIEHLVEEYKKSRGE